jgi:hypothetical protein
LQKRDSPSFGFQPSPQTRWAQTPSSCELHAPIRLSEQPGFCFVFDLTAGMMSRAMRGRKQVLRSCLC